MKQLVLHIGYFTLFFVLIFQFNKKLILNKYQPKELMVAVEVLVTDNDIFQLFYRESEAKFNEKNSQRLKIEASDKAQKLYFRIPDSINASFFRFDIGNKFQTSPVIIKEIALQYNGHIKPINDDNITDYFKPNKFIEVTDKGYVRKVIAQRSDPFLVSVDFSNIIAELKSKPNRERVLINIILSFFLSLGVTSALYLNRGHTKTTTSFTPIFIGCFFSMLVLPHLDELFTLDNTKLNEKRDLVKMPELRIEDIEAYPENFEAFYNDNFGFREKFISLGAILKVKVFNTSPDPETVLVGKDNWLFYWKQDIQRSYLKTKPFSNEILNKYAADFIDLDRQLRTEGKMLIVSIYPNKHTIYDAEVPNWAQSLRNSGPSRAQQFQNYLENHNITYVPQSDYLKNVDEDRRLYLLNDTHWNSLGAYYAYRNLMGVIANKNDSVPKPFNLQDFDIVIQEDYKKGDLLDLLGIDNSRGIFNDDYLKFQHKIPLSINRKNDIYGPRSTLMINNNSGNELTALFLGDSYSYELLQFLPYHFRKTVFVRNIKLDKKIIKEVKPDIIVYGIVERNLENF